MTEVSSSELLEAELSPRLFLMPPPPPPLPPPPPRTLFLNVNAQFAEVEEDCSDIVSATK